MSFLKLIKNEDGTAMVIFKGLRFDPMPKEGEGDVETTAFLKFQCSNCEHVYEIECEEKEDVERFFECMKNNEPLEKSASCPRCSVEFCEN